MDILPQLILILVLIFVNAFFACAEISIVSVNKNKLKALIESKNKQAIKLKQLLDSPSKMLSTIQVAITLAGFLASASAAVSLSDRLYYYISAIPYSKELSIFIVTIMLSYITLVLGELVPKRIGLQHSLKISLFVVSFLIFLSYIFTPIIFILSVSTNIVLKLIGMKNENVKDDLTKEEMIAILNTANIEDSEKEIIENIIEFDERLAREVMIPRPSIFALQKDIKIKELLEIENITRYSRVPIYDNDLDNIIGILHIKDLLLIKNQELLIEDVIKPAYFIPETNKISQLFLEMKENNNHMAILIDEYGGVSGIVTLEDLLEELVGEITDEYDKKLYDIVEISKNKFIVSGELSINDLNDFLDTDFDSEYYDSVAGLIIEKIGFIPEDDKKINDINIDNYTFKVQKVKNKKIQKILIIRNEENNEI